MAVDDLDTIHSRNGAAVTAYSGEVHPAAGIFPLMHDADLELLASDIRANGLRQPLVLDTDGRLLDGRNRLRACELAGVEPVFATVETDDPLGYVVSLNVLRRNLSPSQRAILAAEAWDMVPDSRQERRAQKLGTLFNANHEYVRKARTLLVRDPDAAAEVKAGNILVGDAYEALRARGLATKKQREEVDTLRTDHADLADAVENGQLTITNARASAADRDRVERNHRHAVTESIAEAVQKLDWLLNRPIDVNEEPKPLDEQARDIFGSLNRRPNRDATARAATLLATLVVCLDEEHESGEVAPLPGLASGA
jgi:ParB-like chromosome segregation protein Spo0J